TSSARCRRWPTARTPAPATSSATTTSTTPRVRPCRTTRRRSTATWPRRSTGSGGTGLRSPPDHRGVRDAGVVEVLAGADVAERLVPLLQVRLGVQHERVVAPEPVHLLDEPAREPPAALVAAGADPADVAGAVVVDVDAQVARGSFVVSGPE